MSELVRPFPSVGGRMHRAYADLARLEQAKDPSTVKHLGPVEFIARPWDVAGITDRDLRLEVWEWLERCVDWLNTEYAWQLGDIVPSCWPRHPHLVHELGTVFDQRRRAGLAATSDLLAEWHRYTLPAFQNRMKETLRTSCDAEHRPCAGTARIGAARQDATVRVGLFDRDVEHLEPDDEDLATTRFALVDGHIVDTGSGEVLT